MINYIECFLFFIENEKMYSENTIIAYKFEVFVFYEFLVSEGLLCVNLISISTIHKYIDFLINRNLSDRSICRSLAVIKTLFRYLYREGIIQTRIHRYVPVRKFWKRVPDILTVEEVFSILDQPFEETLSGFRDKAVMETLYGAGIRVSELCSLRVDSLLDECIKVTGKGGLERIVPLNQLAFKSIQVYLKRKRKTSNPFVFSSLSKNGTISRQTVWKIVKKHASRAGIKKSVYPHILRHSFATHMVKNGASLVVLQSILGHRDISTTGEYLTYDMFYVQKEFDRFSEKIG